MNDDQPTPDRPDRLERAMDAMRSIEATIPNHVAARAASRPVPRWRPAVAAAVAAIAVAGGAALLVRPTPALALTAVADAVRETRTIRARVSDPAEPSETLSLVGAGDRLRVETPGFVQIMDFATGEATNLDLKTRVATTNVYVSQPRNPIAFFRDLPNEAGLPIEPLKFDGRELPGFEVFVPDPTAATRPGSTTRPTFKVHVWADPRTKLPARIDFFTAADANTIEARFEQLTFDEPVDAAQLSLDPPAGYKVINGGGVRRDQLRAAATTREAESLILRPGVGIGGARFGMTLDEVKAAVGEPDLVTHDGFGVEYYSRGFGLTVDKRVGLVRVAAYSRDYLNGANLRDFPGQTDRGIGMGATREQVVAAYGEPASQRSEGEFRTIAYPSLQLTITLKNGRVIAIALGRPRAK